MFICKWKFWWISKYFQILRSSEFLHNMKFVGLEKLNNFHFGHFFIWALDQWEILCLQLTPWVFGKFQNQPIHLSSSSAHWKQSVAAVRRWFAATTGFPRASSCSTLLHVPRTSTSPPSNRLHFLFPLFINYEELIYFKFLRYPIWILKLSL